MNLIASNAPDTQSIFLKGLRIDAQIGVFAHEKGRLQPLSVDVEVQVSAHRFRPQHDRLDEVFDYQALRRVLIEVAGHGHIHLLETLADRAIERMLALPDVVSARLRISKFTAFDDCDAVGVEVCRSHPS